MRTLKFIQKAKKIHGETYDYSEVNYIHNQTKIKILCKNHGVFEQRPDVHLRGFGCPSCSNKKKYTTKTWVKKAKEVHGDIYDYSEVDYINNITLVTIICKDHGKWKVTPNNHLRGSGCKHCIKPSIGEIKILEYLNSKFIKYETQKRFKTCRDKRPLPFDFYLPNHNICIEYDGMQHYRPHSFNSKHKIPKEELIENLLKVKHHDNIKNIWCKEHKVKLVRISYKENNIESVLDSMLL